MKIGPYYIVKDTGIPADMPPKTKEELVSRRLAMFDMQMAIGKAKFHLPNEPEIALAILKEVNA